jgi:hypothetical protein
MNSALRRFSLTVGVRAMTTKQVAALVSEAIALDQQIALLQEQLSAAKTRLIEIAAGFLREADIEDPLNLGVSYSLPAEDECHVAQISWPKPRLISGFWFVKGVAFRKKDDQTIEVGPVKELAGENFPKLFFASYKPAKSFRDLAPALLGAKAEKLLALCEEGSSARVSFRTKGEAG